MLSNKQIASIYAGYVNKIGEREAYERFMEKYPDHEGELNLLILGKLDLEVDPALRAGHVDITELMAEPEADEDDELDTTILAEDDYIDEDDDATPVRVTTKEKTVTATTAAPTTKTVTPRGESKKAKALAIYQNATDKSRKNIIALFQSELQMSSAGAATYYQNVKKLAGA